jgi:hypothetical protein
MKYVYSFKLEEDQYEDFVVIEYINGYKNAVWTLDYLLNFNESNEIIDSTNEIHLRAKYWLKENHPELLI